MSLATPTIIRSGIARIRLVEDAAERVALPASSDGPSLH